MMRIKNILLVTKDQQILIEQFSGKDQIYHSVYQTHRVRCTKNKKELAIFNTHTNIYTLSLPFLFPFGLCETSCETHAL